MAPHRGLLVEGVYADIRRELVEIIDSTRGELDEAVFDFLHERGELDRYRAGQLDLSELVGLYSASVQLRDSPGHVPEAPKTDVQADVRPEPDDARRLRLEAIPQLLAEDGRADRAVQALA